MPNSTYSFEKIDIVVRENETRQTSKLVYLFLFIGLVGLIAFFIMFFGEKIGIIKKTGGAMKFQKQIDENN